MEYTTDLGTGEECVTVTIQHEELLDVQCESLESEYGVVITDDDGDGSMEFTCTTVSGEIADEIRIDCGNGDEDSTVASNSLTYECDFGFDDN
jgi:hypothetical protein